MLAGVIESWDNADRNYGYRHKEAIGWPHGLGRVVLSHTNITDR